LLLESIVLQSMYEHYAQPLLPPVRFLMRLARSAAIAAALIGFSLGLGVLGYHNFERLGWIDSLLDASMILGGMGPVHPIETTAGKLFASFYALFSGVAFLTMAAVLVAPVLHRFLHHFHVELAKEEEQDG
jgi:hypothetical protein